MRIGNPMQPVTRNASPLNATGATTQRLPARITGSFHLTRLVATLDRRAGFMAACVGILLLALLTRVINLDGSDLWVDETISYFVANRPPLDIIRYTASNIAEHPPGYYFLLHFWMAATGTGEFALRLFSVVGALLSIALMITVTRRWFGNRIALLTGLLLTIQPLAVFLGRDARMYPWYMASVVLMIYLLDIAIARRRVRDWLLLAVAALAALIFNYLTTLVLLALAIFFLIEFRRLKRSAFAFALVLLVLLGLPAIWIIVEPGPRSSALALLSYWNVPWSPARWMPVFLGWPLGGAADAGPTPALVALASLRWLLVLIGIVFMVQPRAWPRRHLQWLLACLIFVPPIAGSIIFVLSKARYYSAVIGFFTLAVALGIVACWRRSKLLGGVLLATLLILNGRDAIGYARGEWRPFSAPVNYILARTRPAEPIIYTFPWDSFLNSYYNSAQLPTVYLPPTLDPITETQAAASARDLFATTNSAWLNLYPTELEPEVVERGMNAVAYPGDKTWFAGSRGVVRYFAERPVIEQSGEDRVWADRIALNRWWRSDAAVAAGDALRLEFEWQDRAPAPKDAAQDGDTPSDLIELSLVGADGQVWAQRVGGPCNGLCPLAEWGEQPVRERAALYIPADVPPGQYEVRLRWLSPSGEPLLARDATNAAPQSYAKLFDAEVLPPQDASVPEAPLAAPARVRAADGSLELISYAPPPPSALPGSTVTIPTQWRVYSALPALDARLLLKQGGQEKAAVTAPLGPPWRPTETWEPGRLLRGQPSFTLPGTLAPGEYRAWLEIAPQGSGSPLLAVDLGDFTAQDRPRNFDSIPSEVQAPPGGPVDWQEGIRLIRGDAQEGQVKPGETLTVRLVWQADRPTGGNWKVFVHLVDEAGVVRGQGDAYPQQGTALTPTWQKGEIIADNHAVQLGADVPPGKYRVRIGFYDEPTQQRLPLLAGGDTFELGQVTVTAP